MATYESAVIRPGTAKNHLRLIRERDQVQVEINGVKVETLYVSEPRYAGVVGVSALANQTGSRAWFDNFAYSWRSDR